MPVTPDDVRHVARLARLQLSDDERARMAEQLARIVEYIDQLQHVDTAKIEPLAHPLSNAVTPLRSDRPGESLPNEEALANAPDRYGPYFRVPRMIEAEDDG